MHVEHSLRPGSDYPETSLIAAAKRELFCLSTGQISSDEFDLSSPKQLPLSVSSDLSVLSSPDVIMVNTQSDADSSPSNLEPAFYPVYSISLPPFESPRVSSSVDNSPRGFDSVNDCLAPSMVHPCSTSMVNTPITAPISNTDSIATIKTDTTVINDTDSIVINDTDSVPVNDTDSVPINSTDSTPLHNSPHTSFPFPSNCIAIFFTHT